MSTAKAKKSVSLSGAIAGNTGLSTVGRSSKKLHYRGYDIYFGKYIYPQGEMR